MYRIAYVGWHGHDNTGDELGPTVFEHSMRRVAPELWREADIVYDPMAWRTCRSTVACLGTLIQPYDLDHPWMRVFRAATSRGPLVGIGLGTLPPRPGAVRTRPEVIRSCIDWFSALRVRGHESAAVLSLGEEKISGDSVFALEWADTAKRRSTRPRLAVNVGDWWIRLANRWGTGVEAVFQAACQQLGRRFDLVLFSMGRWDDAVIGRIAACLSVPRECVYWRNPFTLARVLAECELGLTMKCHASGLLYALGIPTVNVAYQPKCMDLASVLPMDEFTVPLAEATPECLIRKVESLERAIFSVRTKLQERVGELRRRWLAHFRSIMRPVLEDAGMAGSGGWSAQGAAKAVAPALAPTPPQARPCIPSEPGTVGSADALRTHRSPTPVSGCSLE